MDGEDNGACIQPQQSQHPIPRLLRRFSSGLFWLCPILSGISSTCVGLPFLDYEIWVLWFVALVIESLALSLF
jgi:hypothetical protein